MGDAIGGASRALRTLCACVIKESGLPTVIDCTTAPMRNCCLRIGDAAGAVRPGTLLGDGYRAQFKNRVNCLPAIPTCQLQ